MFQVLLLLRIYAIYEGNRKVLLTLLVVYVICYSTTLVTATIGIVQLLRESLVLCSSPVVLPTVPSHGPLFTPH